MYISTELAPPPWDSYDRSLGPESSLAKVLGPLVHFQAVRQRKIRDSRVREESHGARA